MLILASSSPRRTELLTASGIPHVVITAEAPEISDGLPSEIVLENARRKATAAAEKIKADESLAEYNRVYLPILGADTLVTLDGAIFGKPADEADARRMLEILSGRTHTVYTGLCLICCEKEFFTYDTTQVTFGSLDAATIDRYIASGEYAGKAGAYAVQGRAMAFVSSLCGSAANVIGLPVYRLVELAKQAGCNLFDDDFRDAVG